MVYPKIGREGKAFNQVPQVRSLMIIWELVRNAPYQALLQATSSENSAGVAHKQSVSTSLPGN